MNRRKRIMKFGALAMAAGMSLAPAVATMAATSATDSNNTATTNDLANADIIDDSRTGSLAIYKYDITSAEAAGDYQRGTYKATGEKDSRVEKALADYGIQGVQFSYLRVGNVETHSNSGGTGSQVKLVYEIPTELAGILKLTANDAVNMKTPGEAHPCDNSGVYHFTSQQISDALASILEADDIAAKDALETYLYDYGTLDSTTDQKGKDSVHNMPYTDSHGYTYVDDLDLGLYLVVETEVPEQVTDTVNPWFVQLPFTNTAAEPAGELSGGEKWLYDMTCYPKDQTGNPTLDKSVRNAYSKTTAGDKNGTVNKGADYVSDKDSDSLVVYNKDTNAGNKKDTSDEAYVANRGGYTADGVTAGSQGAEYSTDYAYRDTTTASEGDVLDYILVSKLPHISSQATFLSEYTFVDKLSAGITYNQDVKIAFYHDAADANANNTEAADLIWNSASGTYDQKYLDITETSAVVGQDNTAKKAGKQLTVSLTEAGLSVINGTSGDEVRPTGSGKQIGLSDYYMVVYYTATVNSDASVVLGDEGNPNDVQLIWSRTSDSYFNMLEDRNYVYTYALDLTKEFTDHKGDFSKVQFKLYNGTDAYYVVAEKDADGLYYVTGKTTDEKKATVFVPNAKDGSLLVNGIEADTYQLTEIATDDGYSLLRDQIVIDITATDRDVIASVAGATGMDAAAIEQIVKNFQGGIYDENGNLVTAQRDELTGGNAGSPAEEAANGRTIGKTDMYVGPVQCASATVDKMPATMEADGDSENASVVMNITNSKSFLLPQTGGNGLYAVTILGVITVAGGCYLVTRKRKVA